MPGSCKGQGQEQQPAFTVPQAREPLRWGSHLPTESCLLPPPEKWSVGEAATFSCLSSFLFREGSPEVIGLPDLVGGGRVVVVRSDWQWEGNVQGDMKPVLWGLSQACVATKDRSHNWRRSLWSYQQLLFLYLSGHRGEAGGWEWVWVVAKEI